jgi:primosomal protein N' (replication factor Y) (superfamily II helicase)
MPLEHLVDVLPVLRAASFDQTLTYTAPGELSVGIGAVVSVPLACRVVHGYVVSEMRTSSHEGGRAYRPIIARVSPERAFDEVGLHLARWMAERYCCSLSEALSAVVHTAAIPRMVDRFTVLGEQPERKSLSAVPERLITLIWEDLRDGFTLGALMRHPEARRAGDRAMLSRALAALVRARCLARTRAGVAASVREAQERFLEATGEVVRGKRVAALIAQVAQEGVLRRRDAILRGFSGALITRALREGGLREITQRAPRKRSSLGTESQCFTPTPEQRTAIDLLTVRVRSGDFHEILLDGITGSGKTLVYMRVIADVLSAGGRAIVLVPEIALTPQTARRFESAFERVAVLHSGLSERERFDARQAAARGDIDVVVGARSAVFAAVPQLRLIVVDEAHEGTYKQEITPRYHAVEVARERMRAASGVLLLGSATPSLESYAAAQCAQIEHLRLRARATAQALPRTHIVDMSAEFASGNRRIFSTRLIEAISARLERREKIVLFLNRRGSANFLLCRACGVVPECERCSVSLTVHRAEWLLRCHLCDARRGIPAACPACGKAVIREFGAGTQKVAEAAQALFADARVVRMDGDTTTRVGDHARLLDDFARDGDILVGTQMVAKGLDFPTVTLVGVIAADIGLHVPDFRASERTFALLTQVAGRSGRARPGEAIIQTYTPDHPAVRCAAAHDYDGFARRELEERRSLGYPPFGKLVYLGIVGRRQEQVVERAHAYAALVRGIPESEVLGPAPFPVARVNEEWRYRIAIKARKTVNISAFIREHLRKIAHKDRSTRLLVNVDP